MGGGGLAAFSKANANVRPAAPGMISAGAVIDGAANPSPPCGGAAAAAAGGGGDEEARVGLALLLPSDNSAIGSIVDADPAAAATSPASELRLTTDSRPPPSAACAPSKCKRWEGGVKGKERGRFGNAFFKKIKNECTAGRI